MDMAQEEMNGRRQFVPDCVSLSSYGVMMVNQHSSTIWLVFRCGHEYVFTHEGSTAIVTVTLSTNAVHLFRQCSIQANDLAKHAAEWALFTNRANGIVDFSPATDDLSEFCQYYFGNEALEKRAS